VLKRRGGGIPGGHGGAAAPLAGEACLGPKAARFSVERCYRRREYGFGGGAAPAREEAVSSGRGRIKRASGGQVAGVSCAFPFRAPHPERRRRCGIDTLARRSSTVRSPRGEGVDAAKLGMYRSSKNLGISILGFRELGLRDLGILGTGNSSPPSNFFRRGKQYQFGGKQS